MKKSQAIIDLLIIAVIFWSVWSLRFLEVTNIGPISMGVSFVVIWGLLKWRGQNFKKIGLFKPASWKSSIQQAGFAAFLIFAATFIGLGLFGLIFGEATAGSAITEQPDDFLYFLFDIFILTWIFTAIGEEVFFRGFLLNRFQVIFSGIPHAPLIAVFAQAVWFGSGHVSQGMTGVLTTALIGFALGIYFIRQKEPKGLAPLILAHAFVNTFTLTLAFISKVAT